MAYRDCAIPADASALFWEDAERGLRLLHGDALQLLRAEPDESYHLVFADPPYFLSGGGSTCRGGKRAAVDKGSWDHNGGLEAMHAFNMAWLTECRRLLHPRGSLWVSGTSHNIHSVGFGLQSLGYKIINEIAWFKVNPPPNLGCRCFTHATETLLWARKSEAARHVFAYEAMKQDNGGKQMLSLWSICPPGRNEKLHGRHPTQKPEALLDRILRASSQPGDRVLDPFCGSGTTALVCSRLGRSCTTIDTSAEFLDLARRRLLAETRPLPLYQAAPGPVRLSENLLPTDATWAAIVRDALYDLGGQAELDRIYQAVATHQRTTSIPTWRATVRRTLRQAPDINWLGQGRYALDWGQ